MKRKIITFCIILTSLVSFGQQKEWVSKKIGQWSFEKFPIHYFVTPNKVITTKNVFTGKLESYLELNKLGQPDGLTLNMSADGVHPGSAIYTYKGVVVYIVSFFSASMTIQSITNYNKEGLLDGYKIFRELKKSGGYKQDTEKYSNGNLIEINGIKQSILQVNYKDSLLNGKFKFGENDVYLVIEGEAINGKLKWIKQAFGRKSSIREITFMTDSFKIKIPSDYIEGKFSYETYPLISNPTFTNSKTNCLKYGNYNGFPYFNIPHDFDIRELEGLLKKHHPEQLETKANYINNLLDGEFQYRQYIYNNNISGDYIDIFGKAEQGKLLNISFFIIKYNWEINQIISKKKIEYIIHEDTIIKNEYVLDVSKDPIETKTFKLQYPVLLTNSNELGGSLSYYEFNTNYNVLNIPLERSARLEHNKYGYFYFSPFTFDMTDFISTITTKTPKPVIRNIKETNRLLDGDFEFKGYKLHFIGIAKEGIIQKMRINLGFEDSRRVNGKLCLFDVKEFTLEGESYLINYISSSNNQINCQEKIGFIKNKKLTNSSDMEGYENFMFYIDDSALENILSYLKFIDKQ